MSLELKIPPVLIVIIASLLMWIVSILTPSVGMNSILRMILMISAMMFSGYFALSAVISFKNAQTTVDPRQPKMSSSLVTSGVYQRSRNPMYVGLAFLLFSWGIFLNNLFTLIVTVGFIMYMTKFQIKPEERILTNIFGQEYVDYLGQVKRWL